MFTKKEYLNRLVEVVELDSNSLETEKSELIDFLKNEIELLNKKAASKAKKTEESNKVLFDTILEVLEDMGRAVTLDELISDERLSTYSKTVKGKTVEEVMTTQRLASLLSKLREAGKVVKTIEKKKSYYSISEKVAIEE